MIRLDRPLAPADLLERLSVLSGRVSAFEGSRAIEARRLWAQSRGDRSRLRSLLSRMAVGRVYCMYCGDNLGTDIDHFEPIARAPGRTFSWPNHLLACSHCNSNAKRDRFPCDDDGSPMLLDPSIDEPLDHLALVPSTGMYVPLTRRGAESIDVFALNRAVLVQGRLHAWTAFTELLAGLRDALDLGDEPRVAAVTDALRGQPLADVLAAMSRFAALPGAEEVLGARLLDLLADPRVVERR